MSTSCQIEHWYQKLEPEWVCLNYQKEHDYWTDIILFSVLVCTMFFLIGFTYRTFCQEEMRNIHNYIVYSSLFLCLIVRLMCLVFSLTFDRNAIVLDNTLQFYLYYQISFDLINFGIIAQFFQWVDVYYALKNIYDINRLQQEKERQEQQKMSAAESPLSVSREHNDNSGGSAYHVVDENKSNEN